MDMRAGVLVAVRNMLFAGACLLSASAQAELLALTSEEMTAVTAQDGVSFEWDLRINSDAAGNLNTTLCPPADRTQCRIAMKFANREDLGGEWLVFKGFSGRLYFPRFNLDSGTSSASPTAYANVAGRFVNGLGVTVSPYNKPRLVLTFPEDLQIYNFKIEQMAIEYGSGLTAGTGFRADPTDSRSFIGLAINNSIGGQPATVHMDGSLLIFGF